MSEEEVKFASREINGFIASKCFMAQGTARREDFIMQNCSVMKQMSFLQYT
jgi:hypothetical protein